MGLDKAIGTSIQSYYDPRRRIVIPILLIGGSSKFDGMREIVEARVPDHLPENIDIEKLEVDAFLFLCARRTYDSALGRKI